MSNKFDNIYIKQEIKQEIADQELNTENVASSEIDIEEHKPINFKTEPTKFESYFCTIKSEKEDDIVDAQSDVDPLAFVSCRDAESRIQFKESKIQINCGEEPSEKSTSNEITFLPKHFRKKKRKTHICHVCNKTVYSSNLAKHLSMHNGEKPFECTICKKKFSQSSHLVPHLRTHTGEKPYECNTCNKKFSKSSDRTAHARSHTGEKPYECNVCKKKFSRSFSLTLHLRIHTGEKPYECIACKKRFMRSDHLIKHSRMHTENKS